MRGFRCSSNSKSRDTSVPDSGPTQKPPIKDETTETRKEDTPKTTETPTEVTTESSDMAASGNSSYIGELKDQVKKNKTKIEELKQQLEDHNQNCVQKTKTFEDEIRKLKNEIDVLMQKVQTLEEKNDEQQSEHKEDKEEMKNSYQWLEDELNQEKEFSRSMETKCDSMKTDYEAKLKCLTGNKDLLCLRQLCVDVQVQIYQYVMREDFNKIFDTPDIATIENFIDDRIDDPEKKTRAKERLQILKAKNYIKGALSHLKALKSLKKIGDNVTHPELDEEKIKTSISNLREDNKLDDKRYAHVQELATIWKESKSLLNSSG